MQRMPKRPKQKFVERTADGHFVIHPGRMPYRIKIVDGLPPDRLGDCSDPLAKIKRIRVAKSTRGKKRLEKVIHETLHRMNWWLDEEWVRQTAVLLAELLWEMGYRGDPKAAVQMIDVE